ncbi:ankyrin repeat domain-containing protein, partial [Endozoicomonas sp. ONNA2]|uniref:ankyrin repeat domain-containing protein n=1 Tax=Endozoicomonas sp. ONNA2 TaxID=2828741 RepID=UPI002147C890
STSPSSQKYTIPYGQLLTRQFGGRSLVKTSCPTSDVFHLECITERLEHQSSNSLEQRECLCNHPALPLIRLDGMQLPEDVSAYCETRMFQVCRTGDLQALTELLGEDETLANRTYHSVLTGHPEYPLSVTIKHDHTDCARMLIDRGADVAADHQGETPLHLAAKQGNTEIVKTLLAAEGINVNEKDDDSQTALHYAACMGHAEIIEALLADNGIAINGEDNYGRTQESSHSMPETAG